MKRKLKQRRSPIPPILTKQTINSLLQSINIEKTTTYDVGNPNLGLGQEQTCGGVKLMHWNWKSCPNKLLKMYYCFHQILPNVAKYDWTNDNTDITWVDLFYLKSESDTCKVNVSRFMSHDNVLALISLIFFIEIYSA